VLGLGALEYAVLAPAACIAAIVLLVHSQGPPNFGLTLPWAIAVPVGTAAALVSLRFRDRWTKGWRRHVGRAVEAVGVVRSIAGRPLAHGGGLAGMALYWFGDVFTLWAALHAFVAAAPSVLALILGYATGYALTRRSLPLAGAGIVESLLPFALGWVGIELAPAVAAVVAYRVCKPLAPARACRDRAA
jgi:hypothetical protein